MRLILSVSLVLPEGCGASHTKTPLHAAGRAWDCRGLATCQLWAETLEANQSGEGIDDSQAMR